ncbi:MAG: hypothetical protein IIA64_11490, partial [Planctomycetes bacterium]|nr:hypothetical protein [Planctomycetota bacterium]
MSCSQNCFKGAVVVGLIAALTPGLWAQTLAQQRTTPDGQTIAPGVPAEAQRIPTARGSRLSDILAPGRGTDAPPTAPAQGGLIWFTNQTAFEAFSFGEGKILQGIEDFEESILPPGSVDGFDDPLEFGVPNLPDGFPFPVGMTGLPNLIVQSNLGGGDPSDENPSGFDGLAAVSAGSGGAVSDVVAANIPEDSLDLIFTEEKSGVGFNTITFSGGPSVEVRVYSMTNVFLGMMTTPADPSGANFIGVWSPDPIGRINIFDPGGFEGADNIQAWEAGPPGGLLWTTSQAAFEKFNAGEGNVLKGIEDYEESILPPDSADGFDDPLESGVPNLPNGSPFPAGMTGLPNLRVQSNLGGGDPMDENPRGQSGLAAVSVGLLGAASDVVLAGITPDSLDVIFTDEKSAVGFNTVTMGGGPSVEVRVYSTTNVFLG